jgi:heme/copper-type cytochrome/quinol oxidase subunit 2
MQAPPPTTLTPEQEHQLRHVFDHASDTTSDVAWILIVMVSAVLVLFTVAVILFVAALWRRAKVEQAQTHAPGVAKPSTTS